MKMDITNYTKLIIKMEGKIDKLIKDKKIGDLNKLIDELSNETYPVNDSKPALTHMSTKMGELSAASCTEVCEHAILVLKNRQQPFIEAVSTIKSWLIITFLLTNIGYKFQERTCRDQKCSR